MSFYTRRPSDDTDEHAEARELKAGTVTRLVAQKKNPMRVSVFIDGAYAFGVHRDVLYAQGLRKEAHVTADAQRAAIDADRVMSAKLKAMDYVARRARTVHEVRQKLLEKGFPEAVVEIVVARLHELGYLDDAAYARAYAQRRFEAKGYGPQRIRQELRRRGVADRYAEAAMEHLLETADPLEAARAQAEKRWARLASETDPRKRRKKLSDYLLRRGFSYDVIRQVTEALEAN